MNGFRNFGWRPPGSGWQDIGGGCWQHPGPLQWEGQTFPYGGMIISRTPPPRPPVKPWAPPPPSQWQLDIARDIAARRAIEQAQRQVEQARARERAAREAQERAARERQREEQQQRLREQMQRQQGEQRQRQHELQEQQRRLQEQLDRQRHQQEQMRLLNMRMGQGQMRLLNMWIGQKQLAQSMTNHWKLLLPTMKADRNYKITSYGAALKGNKERLLKAFDAHSLPEERRVLMMAMAMIETNKMSPSERDSTKDKRTDKSANASIFNLSEDMLNQLGYQGNIHLLDPLERLSIVVGLINKGIDTWGVTRMLNFVRGGRKAFNDGVSYGAADYRNAVATILKVISMSPSLMSDDRRVEIYVPHQ